MDKSEAEQKEAERKFKELGDILEILTDPFRRQLYDEVPYSGALMTRPHHGH